MKTHGIGSRLSLIPFAAVLMAGLLITAPRASAVSTIHVNCSRQDLQAKIDLAPPGSILVITGTCHGNFHLAQNMTLKGTKSATLDGDDTGTTLAITGTPTVHLIGLIVTGGLAPAGGGINKAGGRLTLDHVTVEFNLATGQDAQGGGILSQAGSLRLTDSAVVHNRALSSRSGGASATGGGIRSLGPLTIIGSVLDANRAVAISSGNNSLAEGGGISEGPEPLTVSNSHIDGNHLFASGPLGAGAVGGGINEASPSLSIADSTLSKNVATASGAPGAEADGGGLAGGFSAGSISQSRFVGNLLSAESSGGSATALGGALQTFVGKMTLTSVRISQSQLSARGASRGTAAGGGVDNEGRLAVVGSTISDSSLRARGGTGTAEVDGGGIYETTSGTISITRTTVDHMSLAATSGNASPSVSGQGGGVFSQVSTKITASTLSGNVMRLTARGSTTSEGFGGGLGLDNGANGSVTNSTVSGNAIHATASNGAGDASALGGGLYGEGGLSLLDATVARNLVARAGHTGAAGGGGLLSNGPPPKLEATILALNTAPPKGGPNCYGSVSSGGHNLVGTTSGCQFAHKTTDKLHRDPKLGSLADNGGATHTLALLSGSPAIDAIPRTACAVRTDQRGVRRPQGPRCDIGAYERKV